MLEFRKSNPRRPVDWKWQRACHLLEHGGRVSRLHDDRYVKEAKEFRQTLLRCTTDEHTIALSVARPEMFEAYCLFQDENDKDCRWELEARLLADEELDSIARKIGITVDTISTYENCFFNVSEKLRSPAYITHQVITRSMRAGLSERIATAFGSCLDTGAARLYWTP